MDDFTRICIASYFVCSLAINLIISFVDKDLWLEHKYHPNWIDSPLSMAALVVITSPLWPINLFMYFMVDRT